MAKLKKKQNVQQHFSLRNIQPMTANQEIAFQEYDAGKNLMLSGCAGVGKTYLSLYLALREILQKNSPYYKIIIVRSVVPSRDMGFLPGNSKEKAKVYEEPYRNICDDLFGRGDGYDILTMKGMISFTTTSYLRGITFNDAIVIVDEVQNLSGHECDTVITRIGENSRIVFCGDFKQTDLNTRERVGFLDFQRIIKDMNCFSFVEFGIHDIVRSGLVREYLTSKEQLNISI